MERTKTKNQSLKKWEKKTHTRNPALTKTNTSEEEKLSYRMTKLLSQYLTHSNSVIDHVKSQTRHFKPTITSTRKGEEVRTNK